MLLLVISETETGKRAKIDVAVHNVLGGKLTSVVFLINGYMHRYTDLDGVEMALLRTQY